jgi:tripartite-type tricarboxylate transporter receptor subunit TctC
MVLVFLTAAYAVTSAFAQTAKWPARPVTIVVASAPGSAPDILARVVADPLGARLGQTVIVENRPGASGGIGAGFVARAKPDGLTLLMMTPVMSFMPAINPQSQFDPVKSFAPVAMLASVPLIVVATPQTNATTLSEFVAFAKKQPGKLNWPFRLPCG